MSRDNTSIKIDNFKEALIGKKIPTLTLDHKWYRLLDEFGREATQACEEELNALLKKQGRLNSQLKNIRQLKMKLMSDIVPMVEEMSQTGSLELGKKINENKMLIEECNEKITNYQEELAELPKEIQSCNAQLMLITMENCYQEMKENTSQIEEIETWVSQIRIDLKKKLIEKQSMEQKNHEIYSYMHDIFGADVIDLFDMTYNPEEKHPLLPGETKQGLS